MAHRSCGTCFGFGILVSALMHGLGLSLVLHGQPPVQGAGAEAGLELELAMFAPAAGGMDPRPLFTPDATEATLTVPQPETAPLDIPPPDRAPIEMPPIDAASLEKQESPPATPTPPPPPQPKPQTKPKPKPKPKPADQPTQRPPGLKGDARRTPWSPQVSPATLADVPLDASPASAPGPGQGLADPAASAVAQGGKGSSFTAANTEGAYLAELQRAIKHHQRYPEQARREGREGIASLSFVLLGDGRFDQARVVRSSGDPELDQAAIEAIERLGRFRPIPLELGRGRWPLRVSIRFDLR